MNEIKKSFPAIDVAKLIMAILVVMIHKPLFRQDFPNYLMSSVIAGAAVPFFFAVSGFLLFRKLNREAARPVSDWLHYEKRLLQLYALYTIIYLPCIFVKNHTGHYNEITLGSIAGESFLLVKNFFLSASFVHLWYMSSLILGIAILFGFTRIFKNKWAVLLLGAAAYAGTALADALPQLGPVIHAVPPVVYYTLKTGLPCLCLGYFAAQTQNIVRKREKAVCPAAWVVLLVCGIWAYGSDSPIWEIMRAMTTFLCTWATLRFCIGADLKPHPAYGVMRRYSTLIYFLHLLLMDEGWAFLCRHVGIRDPFAHPFLYFSVTLFLAVAEATIIILLQKRKRFDFLKVLF